MSMGVVAGEVVIMDKAELIAKVEAGHDVFGEMLLGLAKAKEDAKVILDALSAADARLMLSRDPPNTLSTALIAFTLPTPASSSECRPSVTPIALARASFVVLGSLESVRIVSMFGIESGWEWASCSKNEEYGEKDAKDDGRNFSFSEHCLLSAADLSAMGSVRAAT
jgi:hypothetical protein